MAQPVLARLLSGDALSCDVKMGGRVQDVLEALATRLALPPARLRLSRDGALLESAAEASPLAGLEVDLVILPQLRALSGAADNAVRLWDVDGQTCLGTLEGHTELVLALAVDFGHGTAVSASADETLRVWDLRAMSCLRVLKGHTDAVMSVAADFASAHPRALSGCYDGTLRVWDLDEGVCTGVFEDLESGWISAVARELGAGQRLAVCGCQDGSLHILDVDTCQDVGTLSGHYGWISAISSNVQLMQALSCASDGEIRKWDLKTKLCIACLQAHSRTVVGMAVDFGSAKTSRPCSVVSSTMSTLCVWEFDSQAKLADWRANSCEITGNADNANEETLMSVWDYESEMCDTINPLAADIVAFDGHPGACLGLTGHSDGSVRVWDTETQRCCGLLTGHSGPVRAVVCEQGLKGSVRRLKLA